jgi:hypothetical protein
MAPVRIFVRVDFPEPFGPIPIIASPKFQFMSNETSFTATVSVFSLNSFRRWLHRIDGNRLTGDNATFETSCRHFANLNRLRHPSGGGPNCRSPHSA